MAGSSEGRDKPGPYADYDPACLLTPITEGIYLNGGYMEDLIYQSEVAFELGAVKDVALSSGYQSHYKDVAGHVFLDIVVSSSPYLKMWQWVKASKDTFSILSEENPERMVQHTSGTTFVIYFTPSTLPELASFLKRFLLVYGGWVGVEDEMEIVYNAEDIETIVQHPFFDPVQ